MRAKKFLSLLMSLAMILTTLPLARFTAFAEDGRHTSGDFEYIILEDGTAEITDYTGNAETLDIPSKFGDYKVTSIGWDTFSECSNLTSVTIPDSVTSIGYYAFYYCSNLTSVTIPDSVISIGEGTFTECSGLTSITIPDSVTSIGDEAFAYCHNLAVINVDSNNKNYTSQDGVLFDKNKTELIQYPIGNERKTYDIPKGVTSIGRGAFRDCDNLTSVTIPNSVTSIGGSAFYECSNLTSVTIPDSVTSIGDWTFAYCSSITSITIPESVISIGLNAFSWTGYYYNDLNWENGVLYIDNCLIEADSNKISQNYAINEGTRVIAVYAFGECSNLTSVTIPDSVTIIGDSAFDSCDSLTDIYILNKDCNIVSSEDYYTIPTETTIHGYAGSTAETFAKENGNKFVAIDGEPVTPDPDKQNAIGDVDGNKNITITDAKWILQNTVKSRNLTEAQAKAADLNKDGKVTIVDAKWVLQIVVGLRDAQTLKPIKK